MAPFSPYLNSDIRIPLFPVNRSVPRGLRLHPLVSFPPGSPCGCGHPRGARRHSGSRPRSRPRQQARQIGRVRGGPHPAGVRTAGHRLVGGSRCCAERPTGGQDARPSFGAPSDGLPDPAGARAAWSAGARRNRRPRGGPAGRGAVGSGRRRTGRWTAALLRDGGIDQDAYASHQFVATAETRPPPWAGLALGPLPPGCRLVSASARDTSSDAQRGITRWTAAPPPWPPTPGRRPIPRSPGG